MLAHNYKKEDSICPARGGGADKREKKASLIRRSEAVKSKNQVKENLSARHGNQVIIHLIQRTIAQII